MSEKELSLHALHHHHHQQQQRRVSAPGEDSNSNLLVDDEVLEGLKPKSMSMATNRGHPSDGNEELFLEKRYGTSESGFDSRASLKPLGARPMGFDVVARVKRLEKRERSKRRIITEALEEDEPPTNGSFMGGFSFMRTSRTSSNQRRVSTVDEGSPLMGNKKQNSIHEEHATTEKQQHHEQQQWKDILIQMTLGRTISVLLLFLPFAYLSHHWQWSASVIFWCNFFAMVPLASILGDFTEEVAAHTNQVIGGLVNATFGNMVEVVVAIQALLANEIRVVQATMIGSIFSNLLLVLGCCFFFGGLKNKEQYFNSTAATANMSLLALSSIALVLPTPFAEYYDVEDEHVLAISRFAAIFLAFMYIQLLVFQLKTHAHVFEDDDDEQEDEEEPALPMWVAMAGLFGITILVAIFSDYLVGSIDGFTKHSGVSRTFVGLIILPIVGNAVEHLTAVSVAMKDKMDLAMGISIGSCTQISLFVIPLTVIVGWICDKPMTLNFPHFEIILYILSIFTVSICIANPKGNWLEGSLLITTYVMIAMGFWYERVVDF